MLDEGEGIRKSAMKWNCSLLLAGAVVTALHGQETRPIITQVPRPSASVAAPSATEARPNDVSSNTYIIGSGDTLQLSVWKEPSMSSPSVPVRPDGQISLALLGDVPAAGITPMALSNDIAGRLKKYVNDPLVTVTVVSVRPKEVYLIGEVLKTGPILLTPGMNPLQAIAAAGGLNNFAKKKLYILRKTGAQEQKIPFDYKKAIRSGDQQGVTLMPGDTIVVP